MVSKPHGGKLVNRVARKDLRESLREQALELHSMELDDTEAADVENLAYGVYSPLEGFVGREDFESILETMRLSDDIPWSIPIILTADEEESHNVHAGDDIALRHPTGQPMAIMHVEEVYAFDKQRFCTRVFGTSDSAHPGVARISEMGGFVLAGDVTLFANIPNPYEKYTLRPAETSLLFREKNWKTVAAFQTRNVPHIGHEYLQKTALSLADGVFINPVVGRKREGDFKDDVILGSYAALLSKYFPRDTVVLSILLYEMRYAGPREAIMHAIMRKNFGCTHIIIGRDHAGVGNYYKPYDAQEIFKEFPDLGITPLFFREFFFCRGCEAVVNERMCPHPEDMHVKFSGTRLREMILRGVRPPREFMRPEVVDVVMRHPSPFVE